MLTGTSEVDRRADLRPRPGRPARTRREEVDRRWRASTGSSTCTRSCWWTSPRCRSRSTSERGQATAQAGGRPPGGVASCCPASRSGDIHRDDKVYDVIVWSMPETRHSLTSIRELLIDTPDGGRVRLARRGRRQHRADAERDQPREPLAPHRRRGQRQGPRPRRGRRRGGGAPRATSSSRSGTTRSCWASTPSARRRSSACCSPLWPPSSAIFLLLQASFGSWRLAALSS